MSIIKTFVDAFKKASAPKEKASIEQVRNEGGLGVSGQTDAFDPPPPPPPGGGSASGPISGGGSPPIDVRPIKSPPSQPTPPKDSGDQGPIEGGGGGTPPPPSAPFDPNQVTFPQAGAGGTGGSSGDGRLGGVAIAGDVASAKDIESDDKLGNFEIQDISDKAPPTAPPPLPPLPGDKVPDDDMDFDKRETDGGGNFKIGDIKGESTDIRHIGTNFEDRAPVEGGDAPEFGDISDVPSRRGPLVQVEQGSEGGGSQLDPNHDSGGAGGDEEAIRLDRGGGETARQTQNTSFGDKVAQGAGNVASSDPEEGGEVAARSIGNVKYEDVKLADDPGSGDALGALAKGKAQPGDLTFTHVYDKASPALAPESDDPSDPFDIKLEEVVPSTPGGVPIPYPNVEAFDGIDGESMDKDHKGEIDFARGRGDLSPEPPPNLSADELARKAGEGQKEFLDIKLHDVLVSSARDGGGEPDLPEGDDDGFLEGLAQKTAKGEQPYLEIKLHDILVSSVLEDGSPEGGPDSDDDGLVDALARKAGEGQKDFLVVKMQDAFISREADDGVDGESTTKDHTRTAAFSRRTEVRDANDRYANVESQAVDDDYPDDDDFESSALLDLKPDTTVNEMLPGLAGSLPDDIDLDLDLDGDDVDADTDESEL